MGRPKRTVVRILGLATGLALFVAAAVLAVRWLEAPPPLDVGPPAAGGSDRASASTNERVEAPPTARAPLAQREAGTGWPTLFGRVIADVGFAPIEGARIGVPSLVTIRGSVEAVDFAPERSREIARADAEGYFEIEPAARGDVLCVGAEGFGAALLERDWLGVSRDEAFVVRLDVSAMLHGRVIDADDVPIEGVHVRLSTSGGYFGMRPVERELKRLRDLVVVTEVASGADGQVACSGLPGFALFDLEFWRSDASVWRDPVALYLEPGTTQTREWRFPTVATVNGRAIDESGREAAGVELILTSLPSAADVAAASAPSIRPMTARASELRLAAAIHGEETPIRADASGRFMIRDVPAGRWVVLSQMSYSTLDRDGFLPSAEPLAIERNERSRDLVVVVRRGRSIRGKVLDPQGRVAPANVRVSSLETGPLPFLPGATDENGRFAVGPLEGETYQLTAEPLDASFVTSEPVVAAAGKDDVVLRLRPGMLLQAHATREEDDARVSARFVLFPHVDPETPIGDGDAWRSKDGAFRGIRPGRYDLVATTDDDRIGIERELQVREGSQLPEVRVKLVRGARLVLRLAGAPREEAMVEVHTAGTRIALEKVATAAATTLVVPAGTTTVVWRGHLPHRDTVELRAGETRELVWPRPP